MRATWLADVLTDAGIRLKPFPGWETRGGSSFKPVGVMWHHTVTKASTHDLIIDKFLATTGSSTTPAPLCNYSTNRDGTISLIAAGTANHGGVGHWTVDGTRHSGNSLFFGDEMKNIGTFAEPWPKAQLETARVATAAILDHLNRTADYLCGHKEYATPPGRKSDPHTLSMDVERLNVEAIQNGIPLPPIGDTDLLPINAESSTEDIRYLQRVIGVATSGLWDAVTVAAVKELATASGTGDPVGKAGDHVNGVMFDHAETEKIRRVGTGGGVSEQRVKELISGTKLSP